MPGPTGFSEAPVALMGHSPNKPADEKLRDIVAGQILGTCDFPDEQRDQLLEQLRKRYGQGLLAVLIYGSYLRGKRDTLLDFYVLLDSYRSMPTPGRAGWPKHCLPTCTRSTTAHRPMKFEPRYALLTLDRFEQMRSAGIFTPISGPGSHSPAAFCIAGTKVQSRVINAVCQASKTFHTGWRRACRHVSKRRQLWATGLGLTYQCEFRSEPPGHAEKLFGYWPDYYRSVTSALAGQGLGFEATGAADSFDNSCSETPGAGRPASWWLRRVQGKVLSTLRIIKAALTFDGALDYLLWKVQRHSGVYIEPTDLQRNYPLIFAWPLLFRLWRRGAFR